MRLKVSYLQMHGKDALDIQVHSFLLHAIYGCVIFSLLETWKPNEVILTYGERINFLPGNFNLKIYSFKHSNWVELHVLYYKEHGFSR